MSVGGGTTTTSPGFEIQALTDQLIDAGFMPAMDAPEDLAWLVDYQGFHAYREEDDGTITAVGQTDNQFRLVSATRNYLINSEARFDVTPQGIIWFLAAINADPDDSPLEDRAGLPGDR
jgi:hypothetical protein